METYLYKVFNTEGAMEEGTISASSGGDAANALRLRGFSIISLTKEASEKKERRSFLKRKPFSGDETLFASLQITLPAGARIALAAGKFLQETGRFLFLLPLLSALGLGISLKTEKGREKIDEILYRSRFCKRLLLIRFAATLSAFLESGRTLGDALEDCKDTIGNREAERALEAVKEEVTKGNDFAESLKKSGFSLPIFYQLTRIGMESGELPDFLMKAAGLMEREAERKASRFRAILEPAMLLLVGGMTAIVVFSVILPVFHMAARV